MNTLSQDTQYCVSEEFAKRLTWYRWHFCPLIPWWQYRPANKHNEWSFHFHWLVFRFWTKMTPGIGLSVDLGDQIQLRVDIPYVHTGVFIPIMPNAFYYRFWRCPKYSYGQYLSEDEIGK